MCSELVWVLPHLLWRHMVTRARKLTTPSLALRPALPSPPPDALAEMYSRFNLTLVRAIARSILGNCLSNKDNLVVHRVC